MAAGQLGYYVDMNQQYKTDFSNGWGYSSSSRDSDYLATHQDPMYEDSGWSSGDGRSSRKVSRSSQSRERAKTSVCSEDGASWSSTPPGSPYNASPGNSGVYSPPPPPREQFQTSGEYFRACVEYDSGASTVAIDNKIEQAMDLVKSHLMFAVREEVEVLKEQIKELLEKNSQLEYENSILKANASPETMSKLQQNNPQPPPPSNS